MPYREKSSWGEHMWAFIHTITIIDFENNEYHIQNALKCLRALSDAIPCGLCRGHYENEINNLKINLDEPMCLFKWSVKFHNEINSKMAKPQFTYEEALQKWSKII
jgi:hypothetical protein